MVAANSFVYASNEYCTRQSSDMNKIDITETVKNMFEHIKNSGPGLLSFNFVNSAEATLSIIQKVLIDRGYTSFIVIDGVKSTLPEVVQIDKPDFKPKTKQKINLPFVAPKVDNALVTKATEEKQELVKLYRMYVNVPNKLLMNKKSRT